MRYFKVLLYSIAIAYGVQKGVSTFLEKLFLQKKSLPEQAAIAYDTAVSLEKAQQKNPSLLTLQNANEDSRIIASQPGNTTESTETYDPPLKVAFLDFDLSDANKNMMDQPDFQNKLGEMIQQDGSRVFNELSGLLNEEHPTPQMLNLLELTKRVCEIDCNEAIRTPLEQIAQRGSQSESPNQKLIGQKAIGILLSKIREPQEGTELLERLGIPIHPID